MSLGAVFRRMGIKRGRRPSRPRHVERRLAPWLAASFAVGLVAGLVIAVAILKQEPASALMRGVDRAADHRAIVMVTPTPAPTPQPQPATAADPLLPRHAASVRQGKTSMEAGRRIAALPQPSRPESQVTLPAWRRYAAPAPDIRGRPMIAVVIDDAGLNRRATARVLNLPAPLTLAFMTYADDLDRQSAEARRLGHEVMLHVPMEPVGAEIDSGPNALRTRDGAPEVLRRLRWGLDRLPNAVGVNNHMGSLFTTSEPGMAVVMEELKARGLLFVDSKTVAESVGARVAERFGVPYAVRDVFLDNDKVADAVQDQLLRVEEVARRRGHAIAIGHPHDATIDALLTWLPTLEARGFVLVPVSAIIRRHVEVAG